MKKLIAVILLSAVLALSSCSSLGMGTPMVTTAEYIFFENDTWLVIDNMLINKTNGRICKLEADYDKTIAGIDNIYYYGPYAYKYIFEESSFNQYTFLKTNYYSKETGKMIDRYYECLFTYSYDGGEIARSYIGKPLTPEEMEMVYKNNPSNTDALFFEVDVLWEYHKKMYPKKFEGAERKAILEYAEELYESQAESYSTVMVWAKPIGDEMWFSSVVTKDGHYNSGQGLIEGIHRSEIKAFDFETNEIRSVFEYNKKGVQIIDFDENGIYTFDSKGRLCYVEFQSGKSELIHRFSGAYHSVRINDKYLCISYVDNKDKGYYFLVYEKHGSVIADGMYAK